MNTRNKVIRKCAVDGCLSESNREEDTGVTFHRIPNQPELRSKWFSLCHIIADNDNKKPIKLLYVCSRHFLRVDFCNFKGKKYMLKHGVLPSVFPWDKSKLDAIKVKKEEITNMETDDACNMEEKNDENSKDIVDNQQGQQQQQGIEDKQEGTDNKSEESKEKPKISNRSINFAINSRIEALDFNNTWYPARIVEEDYEENEVLIHFEKFSNKYDEWICMDSPRLRPLQSTSTETTTNKTPQKFSIGERCLASWSDARKFPATITKVLANDIYEVLFDDGFIKTLKAHRISKAEGKQLQSSPLFDPVQSSKQERREKKRKIDIAALFGKRQKLELQDDKNKTATSIVQTTSQNPIPEQVTEDEIYEPWVPEWENGRPVGIESKIDIQDGIKKSIIVPDPRLPIGWVKHLTQRVSGASAGKWDTIIMSPDHRRFRSRSEIKQYLDETKIMKYNWSMFDFSIHRHRNKRKDLEIMAGLQNTNSTTTTTTNTTMVNHSNDESINSGNADESQTGDDQNTDGNDEEESSTLKIPVVNDGGYECPIDGCKKIFRKENLAQMHIKHYHPEYTKYLNSTPNVADLAYARTVGDLLLDNNKQQLPQQQQQQTTPSKTTTITTTTQIKPTIKKQQDIENKLENEYQQQSSASSSPMSNRSHKDSEILKLLNNKCADTNSGCNNNNNNNIINNKNGNKTEEIQPLPSGLPSNMYPDIKLKDLLKKSEGIPPNDLNLKLLSTTRPPSGIKTLLPVIRNNEKNQQTKRHSKGNNDKFLINTTTATPSITTPPSPPPQLLSSQLTTTTTTTNQEITETPQQPPNNDNNNIIIEGGKVIKIVRMKQEEIINCTCGYTEEDGLMIQCDLCLCWQHAFCNNIYTENQVPEKYVCYICQNPLKQRLSKKYYHDQDWLKQGVLPTGNYHTKDDDLLNKRFNKLKKSHDLSGGLSELKDFVNTVKIKLKIAEAKNHPKLYLWSKPWEKLPSSDKIDKNNCHSDEDKDDKTKIKNDDDDDDDDDDASDDDKEQSLLVNMLKNNDSNGDNKIIIPKIPQPEAAINSTDCRLNLLEHIQNVQTLIDERLDDLEKQLDEIDDSTLYQDINDNDDDEVNYPKIRQTTSLLMKDLKTLHEFSQMTTL